MRPYQKQIISGPIHHTCKPIGSSSRSITNYNPKPSEYDGFPASPAAHKKPKDIIFIKLYTWSERHLIWSKYFNEQEPDTKRGIGDRRTCKSAWTGEWTIWSVGVTVSVAHARELLNKRQAVIPSSRSARSSRGRKKQRNQQFWRENNSEKSVWLVQGRCCH